MTKITYTLIIFTLFMLSSCGGGSSEEGERVYTFAEIIENRMAINQELNGKIILIKSNVVAFFDTAEGCADNPAVCNDDVFMDDDGIPKYQGTSVGPCANYGFMLVNRIEGQNTTYEVLNTSSGSNVDFFVITEQKEIEVQFHATLEYVERTPFCSNQKNYGVVLTLKEGEEPSLLAAFK